LQLRIAEMRPTHPEGDDMAERHDRYDDEHGFHDDEPSRTERRLADDAPRGRGGWGRQGRDWERRAERHELHGSPDSFGGRGYGPERSYLGGRGGYAAERPRYEGAGHESGMGWGPEGRVREGYGRPEYGPEGYGRSEYSDRGQRGWAREGFGGVEGYNERGLGGWSHGPGGFGERSYGGYGDWSDRARADEEPVSPRGEHRRRHGSAQWGLGRSGSGAGWRHTLRRGDETAQAGSYAGRGPQGYQRSDERIREDVCDCLMADPDVDASSMSVAVKDGEVTLEGTVEDRRTKRAAEDVVEDVPGVKQVHNRLRVQAAGASQTEAAIAARGATSTKPSGG
jgi:hypothetical protein